MQVVELTAKETFLPESSIVLVDLNIFFHFYKLFVVFGKGIKGFDKVGVIQVEQLNHIHWLGSEAGLVGVKKVRQAEGLSRQKGSHMLQFEGILAFANKNVHLTMLYEINPLYTLELVYYYLLRAVFCLLYKGTHLLH